MPLVYASTSRYTQGPGVTESLGDELRFLGLSGPIIIVSGPTTARLLKTVWERVLGQASMSHEIHEFSGECTRAEINLIKELALKKGARVILGAGGGKAIDAARAAAAMADCSFVSCPTVASTDSPCSALSVIYDEHGVYQGFDSFGMNPALVLVDTAVIIKAPERFFVAGMGDALATVFEARACIQANQENLRGGLSTIAAREIAEACYQTIMNDGRQALEDLRSGIPTPAFERVVEANTLLSGIGFESAGLAAAHGIHNAMTVAPGTHSCLHGEKVSFGVMVQLVLESQPDELIDSVSGFCMDVGLPITLAGVGLSSEDRDTLNLIVQAAIAPGSLIYNEPFEISADLLMDAILEANKRGEAASA